MSRDTIASVDELRSHYRPPGRGAIDKVIDHLDSHCADFLAHAPFVVVASADADGRCDASPEGGPPGFARVLERNTLAWGDLSGNNRLDSLQNLVANGSIGLLFLIPGLDETLRVNGDADVTTDPAVLERCAIDGKVPNVAVRVNVREAYIHCAKALRRAALWRPDEWPDRSDMATIPCMLRDHAGAVDVDPAQIGEALEHDYQRTLWATGGTA